jgi:hypothetical protein
MRIVMLQILSAALVVTLLSCEDTCEPGETDLCYCSDGRIGAQVCKSNAEGWGACECTGDGDPDAGADACNALNRAVCYALFESCLYPWQDSQCEMEWCACMTEIGCDPLEYLPDVSVWQQPWFDCIPGQPDVDTDTDTDIDTDTDTDTDTDADTDADTDTDADVAP